jgi:uncharacterized protein YbcC (UPF0753/DUF2309 family)
MTTDVSSARARLRTEVSLAARVLPTHYPLETFIAVNPLAGLEGMPFEQALRRAGDLYGIRGTLRERTFRAHHRDGRITDSDLDRVLMRRFPNLSDAPDLVLGGRTVSRLELVRADLVHGTVTSDPRRRCLTHSEIQARAVAEAVDAQSAKWCAAFFGRASWPMPGREHGFYSAWRSLAPSDRTVPRPVRAELRRTAVCAEDAALLALSRLGIGDDARISYLQAHLTQLPGWAAHVQWCAGRDAGIDLVGFLAMRLTYEAALLAHYRIPAPQGLVEGAGAAETITIPSAHERAAHLFEVLGLTTDNDDEVTAAARVLTALPVTAREVLWQNAFEAHYRDRLLDQLTAGKRPGPVDEVHTQLVSCIDTRSEGLRRHLESIGGYETLGFAGFFAVAIRFTNLLGGAPSDLCPVLIAPNHEIRETPGPGADHAARRRVNGLTRLAGAESAFHNAKESLAAPFSLAEAAGFAAAPLSAAKTLAPGTVGAIRRRLRETVAPTAPTMLDLDAVTMDDRVLFAQVALTTMGLTRGFGRLVVLCGHGSGTENNPYQASLDCGACGGQSGGPNARTAVAILNQPIVRDRLRDLGIDIPADTSFVAAQHDTATDRVTLLDAHLIPATHAADVERLNRDLRVAGSALAAERCMDLPGNPRALSPARASRQVASRACDWAQVYPEWGLAGNAAFIVGPRELTRGMSLQRRAFLHSYEADVDPDGSALETILTAPLVVAQWINCQYYFSAVAPEVFGAGTKTVHNVIGSVGAIAGHAGDLQLGLPWQSVSDGVTLLHEPMRLLAVVEAPLGRIDAIVDRNPILQRLFGNDWVGLVARDNSGESWQRWTRAGWRPWSESQSSKTVYDKEMVP